MKNTTPLTIKDLFSANMLTTLKSNFWILGLGGVLYQLFFLIGYDALALFSWTQIPADSVFFLLSLLVTYVMAWPWLNDDFWEQMSVTKKLSYGREVLYFSAAYIFILLLNVMQFWRDYHWLFLGLFVQINISVVVYIFVIIKRKIGKQFSENTKSILLFLLVLLNCAMFGGNLYSNYEYVHPKTQESQVILYMNDKYILLEGRVVKNDSGTVLRRMQISE